MIKGCEGLSGLEATQGLQKARETSAKASGIGVFEIRDTVVALEVKPSGEPTGLSSGIAPIHLEAVASLQAARKTSMEAARAGKFTEIDTFEGIQVITGPDNEISFILR